MDYHIQRESKTHDKLDTQKGSKAVDRYLLLAVANTLECYIFKFYVDRINIWIGKGQYKSEISVFIYISVSP